MAIEGGSAKMSDDNLTSLVGILSIPDAFLEFREFCCVFDFFRRCLETPAGIEIELDFKFLLLCVSTIVG